MNLGFAVNFFDRIFLFGAYTEDVPGVWGAHIVRETMVLRGPEWNGDRPPTSKGSGCPEGHSASESRFVDTETLLASMKETISTVHNKKMSFHTISIYIYIDDTDNRGDKEVLS